MIRRTENGVPLTPVNFDSVIDFEERLVASSLEADGVQYSVEVDTTTADVDTVSFEKTIETETDGAMQWVEFGLTAAFRAVSSVTAEVYWKWQGKESGGDWVDLHDEVTETDIGVSYVERTRQGYFPVTSAFGRVPFDVRLLVRSNELDEGRAKVKNSSYIRVVFNPRK